ncbi:MAG: 2-oxoacid:acceptor oxidoreductase subunit alpha [Candidatus Marsarchaeota archaeon]|nr:2-oxoacid:acceptor oxidoreductase subunit alpha [Candidatus Marsarchaeota archaeon]MCL5413323.1 2-oxoacid:acceptor oxidoreductase subunit alpha [Candidatus Marsarchaeota archaeon]
MASVSIRICGANGDGVESSGALVIKVAAKNGLHVFGYRGYQSIIRGGHVWYQIRIGDSELRSHGEGIDILIALNQDSINYQKSHLNQNAIVIYDPSKVKVDSLDSSRFVFVPIPLLDIAIAASGDPIMRNVVAIGAALKFVGIDIDAFNEVIRGMFGRKGEAVVNNNIKAAAEGYNYNGVKTAYNIKGDGKQRYALDGNTALSIGAYAAGCKFYAAYPMTPASTILQWFASHENKGVMPKQTEDEIAAINMTIGAASAGARAMCGTSGGGFSLMVEGLGLAGMLETPIVVVNSQRTGPSTGLPTKTEQADLLFVMHASQGEFPRIVVAPRSVADSFKVTAEAFNLADRYQCPVIILMDLYMSEHIESVERLDVDEVVIDRGKVVTENTGGGRFKRYLITDDGISQRAYPGSAGLEYVAGSDEHDEFGDLISDAFAGTDESIEVRKKMNAKRMRKMDTMLKNEKVFVPHVDADGGFYIVTWGSTTSPALEALEILKSKGQSVGLISFDYILPMDSRKTSDMLKGKKLIDVELNGTGQLAKVIRMNTGIGIEKSILKSDGEAFTGEEIANGIAEIIKSW